MTRTRLSKALVALALGAALFAAAARPSSAFLDKTRFLAHLGVAYFAFHHWVWKPYKDGAFAQGAPHRTSTIVKGGIALLFAVHEVKVAKKVADNSKDPLLQKLDAGLGSMSDSFGSVGARLKSGQFNPADVEGLGTVAGAVSTLAAKSGLSVKDIPAKIPGM